MAPARVIALSGIDCLAGSDARFNTWHDDVHLPMLFKHPALLMATRYRRIEATVDTSTLAGQFNLPQAKPRPQYLTVYEFEDFEAYTAWETSPERTASNRETVETWADGGIVEHWVGLNYWILDIYAHTERGKRPTTRVVKVAGTDLVPGKGERFWKWLAEVHAPNVFKAPGISKFTCSRVGALAVDPASTITARLAPSRPAPRPQSLNIGEFESYEIYKAWETSPQKAESDKETAETWKDGGIVINWLGLTYEVLGTWEHNRCYKEHD